MATSAWLEQLEEMKKALERIKSQIPIRPKDANEMLLDDDDLSGTGDSDSLFDEIEGYDVDGSSSDFLEDDDGVPDYDRNMYDRVWFTNQCIEYCIRRKGNTLGPEELASNLLTLLSSTTNDDELQSILTDILGYEDLDLVGNLILHRESVVNDASTEKQPEGHEKDRLGDNTPFRLLNKQQREEALRKQDLEHKSRPLGPKFAEPSLNYPHIYRAHDAGNTLSISGKKYGLPLDSKTVDYEKYQEITVPAAKAAKIRPGEKLVLISGMDKLCQNTFKGYKSLNRMQSLLYEVAYKTNENMLVCAPTGAVSFYTLQHQSSKPKLTGDYREKLMLQCLQFSIQLAAIVFHPPFLSLNLNISFVRRMISRS